MTAELGKVVSLWRYPVKSMEGEELSECEVTQHGLLGDRRIEPPDGPGLEEMNDGGGAGTRLQLGEGVGDHARELARR